MRPSLQHTWCVSQDHHEWETFTHKSLTKPEQTSDDRKTLSAASAEPQSLLKEKTYTWHVEENPLP
jgi:hypothetical protein